MTVVYLQCAECTNAQAGGYCTIMGRYMPLAMEECTYRNKEYNSSKEGVVFNLAYKVEEIQV